MIMDFIKAWDSRKHLLQEYFESHEQSEYDEYSKLVALLFKVVINPDRNEKGESEFDTDLMTVVNNGDYQGSLLFIIPTDTYQPAPYEYVITTVNYGSCSECDTLLGIIGEGTGLPSREQVKEYMTVCLHLLQRCKYIYTADEYFS